MAKESFFLITDLTEEFGVTTRTLRFYEDRALLNPVRRGRKRLYRPRDRTRLRLILRGKRLGLTLDEIRDILDLFDKPSGEAKQIDKLIERINVRRQALLAQQQDIDDALEELDAVESRARQRLDAISNADMSADSLA